jgi:hypothetical protein
MKIGFWWEESAGSVGSICGKYRVGWICGVDDELMGGNEK